MQTLKTDDLKMVKLIQKPPQPVFDVMNIVLILFQDYNNKTDTWKQILALLGETKTDQCVDKFNQFEVLKVPREVIDQINQ